MKHKNKKRPWYMDYLMIIVGTGLMAISISSVYDASEMVTGGFSGIAIIIKFWTEKIFEGGIPLWVTNLLLNVPLFIGGFFIGGFSFVSKSVLGSVILSAWLAILPVFDLGGGDLLLAAIYGGIIQGVGIGLIFLGRGNTGGTDMLATLIQRFLRHYSIAQIMRILDGAIVVLGICVFGLQKALYAMVSVYLVTKVSDGLIEGLKFSKAAYIITRNPDEIAQKIFKVLDRGVTGIYSKGMYTGQDRVMIYCVVNKKEIVVLRELIEEIDPEAFMIVSDAREVHGKGFIERV